jgi:ACR3 family arsenite efflux pump ArsB
MNPLLFIFLCVPVIAGIYSSYKMYTYKKISKKSFITNTIIAISLTIVAGILLTYASF